MTNLLELTTKPTKKRRVQPDSKPVNGPSDCQTGNGSNDGSDCSDSNSLISAIGRDNSIDCLVRCSRSEYGSLACVNRSFRSLIQGGELYRLRRQLDIVEHWVYFNTDESDRWDAYDLKRNRWMTTPQMPIDECFKCAGIGWDSWDVGHDMPYECFKCAGKEALAVGTELLVFGEILLKQVVLRYSILSNSWTFGAPMNKPRFQFASASFGEKAIVAGGLGESLDVSKSAELYSSETGCWVTLPSMNKDRWTCSGAIMDGKFYVVGGKSSNSEILTCGEEYDLEKQSWRVIPNMSAGLNCVALLPPLVAVVRNELYTADYTEMVLRKYDKKRNVWVTLGPMQERPGRAEWCDVAFCACGNRLLAIDTRCVKGWRMTVINSWVPDNDGPPQWNVIAERYGISVVDCVSMGC